MLALARFKVRALVTAALPLGLAGASGIGAALVSLAGCSSDSNAFEPSTSALDSTADGGGAGADAGDAGPPPYRLCPKAELANDAGWIVTSGYDVSEYEYVDWNVAGKNNPTMKYAVARATAGTDHVDTQFARNWSGMASAGLVRGSYHYFRAEQNGADQADRYLQTLDDVGGLGAADFPPVLDIEDNDGMPDGTVACRMKSWLARVEGETGRVPIIFTIQKYNSFFDKSFSRYPLWTSNWVANTRATCPRMLTSWKDWDLWQYTSSGTIDGVYRNASTSGAGSAVIKSGAPETVPCDVNFYNGTSSALDRFIAGTVSPGAPDDPTPPDSPPTVSASAGTDCSDGCCQIAQ